MKLKVRGFHNMKVIIAKWRRAAAALVMAAGTAFSAGSFAANPDNTSDALQESPMTMEVLKEAVVPLDLNLKTSRNIFHKTPAFKSELRPSCFTEDRPPLLHNVEEGNSKSAESVNNNLVFAKPDKKHHVFLSVLTEHFDGGRKHKVPVTKKLNEANRGVSYSYAISPDTSWEMGTFRNSHFKRVNYVAINYMPVQFLKDGRAGIAIGSEFFTRGYQGVNNSYPFIASARVEKDFKTQAGGKLGMRIDILPDGSQKNFRPQGFRYATAVSMKIGF